MRQPPIVIAMTGASGASYGLRLVEVLLRADREIHFVCSDAARQVMLQELGLDLNAGRIEPRMVGGASCDRLTCWRPDNLTAAIASGSFPTSGMAIVPCSLATLGAIATGVGNNLIHRAAEVHLKERRPLILTPRETPLSLIALRNLSAIAEAGGVILPAMPGFYHRPTTLGELIDFVVSRICVQLGVAVSLGPHWGGAR